MTTARDTYNQIVYAKEQGLEEGRKEGEKKGREEGLKEGKQEIARKMLALGVDMKIISASTDLTSREIEALKETASSE